MKLNFTVEVSEYDNDINGIENEIISEAARQLINEVMNNRYEHPGRTFREKLKEEVKIMMLDIMDTDFKEEVKKLLADELSKRYTRSRQYREIKEQFSIDSDAVIKSGLKEIMSDLINSEIKKKFR